MIQGGLLDMLVCPWCLSELERHPDRLTCRTCGAVYGVIDAVPHMLVDEAELHCPVCRRVLAKQGREAVCVPCNRRYPMDARLSL